MEFEAEEEQQIQKMKLLASCSQFQAPAPKATKPPASPVPESGQQQGSVFPQSPAAWAKTALAHTNHWPCYEKGPMGIRTKFVNPPCIFHPPYIVLLCGQVVFCIVVVVLP